MKQRTISGNNAIIYISSLNPFTPIAFYIGLGMTNLLEWGFSIFVRDIAHCLHPL